VLSYTYSLTLELENYIYKFLVDQRRSRPYWWSRQTESKM